MACGECGIGLGEVTLECEDNTSPVRDVTSEREDKTSPDELLAALSETSRKIRFQIDSGASLTVMKESEATDYPLVKPDRDRYIRERTARRLKMQVIDMCTFLVRMVVLCKSYVQVRRTSLTICCP